ncbi:Endochitinase 3 [Lasiodiplodia hormozganensis]|uniref:chitinase n=2 Tax=Lasiodiplodia TaxID=66739 RepID=A0A5N5D9Q6_9PEZI|nr:Glycoside hydrolase family 18 [Lasiodiplodia theobromae]KAB2574556.1 Endochitinase 3 [Lasiodiplodia theobromae]KAF4537886.1 Glycoside hydrolase family 18 [Lasiodiplodia theobromae]KAK0664956.1 Endochitinase 3 [Lasiodiplodia hormozganensis]
MRSLLQLALLPVLARAHFNPNGTSNLFVYYAQASGRSARLDDLCVHPAVDAVILGFIRDFNGTAGYPTVDFGPWICPGRRPPDAAVAPGLATCPELAAQVQKCQDRGKKIFISIGGATSNTSLDNDADAQAAARRLWQLFGQGSESSDLRPLGKVSVDGFDIDHEVGSPSNYDTFAKALRSLLATASKPMWISAAPLCALTNRSIGPKTLALVDFIFVRFYNSKACSIGTKGFAASLNKWYTSMPEPEAAFPKFCLSGLSFDNNNSGFVRPEDFADAITLARKPNLQRFNQNKFGGVALWDGSRGLATTAGNGLDFLAYTKNVLEAP